MDLPVAPVPPAPPQARVALDGDEAAVEALRRRCHDETRTLRGGPELVAELQATAVGSTVLGCLGAVPVGYALVALPGPGDRPGARIVELWVEPDAREVGVGRALLEQARRMAVAAGCTAIDSVALPGARSTKNFFEDHGMTARAIVVSSPLEQGA